MRADAPAASAERSRSDAEFYALTQAGIEAELMISRSMEQQSGKPTGPRLVSEHGRSDDADRSLAAWHIPLLLCDRRDPFTPTAVGYRVVPGSAFAPAPEDGTGAPSPLTAR